MKHIFALLLLLVVVSTAATAQIIGSKKTHAFASIEVAAFADTIKNKNVILVDVRTPQEFAEGHIEGAINVMWGKTFDDNLQRAKLDKTKIIAVYCRSGRRSKMAGDRLIEKGYKVVDLDGGITAWQKEGGTVVTK